MSRITGRVRVGKGTKTVKFEITGDLNKDKYETEREELYARIKQVIGLYPGVEIGPMKKPRKAAKRPGKRRAARKKAKKK